MMGVVFTGTVIFKHVIKQLNIKNEVAGCWSEHVEQVLVHRNADKYEVDLTDCSRRARRCVCVCVHRLGQEERDIYILSKKAGNQLMKSSLYIENQDQR